jgi:RNA polymerase sigma-70 factor (ECF subfamily)
MKNMHERVFPLPATPLTVDDALLEEFETRLAESATLAFRVAYSVLRQREEAEDVAQEALVRAYKRFHQLRDRTRFRAWLVRMTWRLALDQQRSTRRRQARELEAARAADPARPCASPADLDRACLWTAIDALPDRLRWPIVLAAIEGYDVREVAALLAAPEGTIKSRLFEARRRLKELLQ